VKEQEIRKVLETVTDDFVRRQTDLQTEIEGELEARQHFRPRPKEGPPWGWIAVGAIVGTALLAVCLILIR
jgi:hypothetical protein